MSEMFWSGAFWLAGAWNMVVPLAIATVPAIACKLLFRIECRATSTLARDEPGGSLLTRRAARTSDLALGRATLLRRLPLRQPALGHAAQDLQPDRQSERHQKSNVGANANGTS